MKQNRFQLEPAEHPIVDVRRHWALLGARTLQSAGLFAIGSLVWREADRLKWVPAGWLRTLALYFLVFVVVRWVWLMLDWWSARLFVTNRRIVVASGVGHRTVASLPLINATTLTYNRSATGMILGYGELVVELGQTVRRISYIPQPDKLYLQISEQLFGR